MKKIFLFLLFPSWMYALIPVAQIRETDPAIVTSNEIIHTERLIETTKTTLEQQVEIKKELLVFQQSQKKYIDDMEDKEKTIEMVDQAKKLYDLIKKYHLVESFDTEFISQISFFAKFSDRTSL